MTSFNKQKRDSVVSSSLNNKKKIDEYSENFKISFQFFDSSQKFGSSFKDWQKAGLLAKALDVLKGFCCNPLHQQKDGDKFTVYGDFPNIGKTEFIKPTHVPEDANWARIHVNGKAIIVGHIVKDTFYVVFLDKSHKFYLTKRATSN